VGDVRILSQQFMTAFCARNNQPGAITGFSPEALGLLETHSWPGNVRELENVLERALVLGEGAQIDADDLELSDRAPAVEPIAEEVAAIASAARPHDAVMDDIERRRLTAALAAANGNQSTAAKSLGMPRTTFINKLRRHGLL
jgi:two-component system NtrC family response regulator